MKVSDMCTHFGTLIGFPTTNVYFEEIELVIKCDLSPSEARQMKYYKTTSSLQTALQKIPKLSAFNIPFTSTLN